MGFLISVDSKVAIYVHFMAAEETRELKKCSMALSKACAGFVPERCKLFK